MDIDEVSTDRGIVLRRVGTDLGGGTIEAVLSSVDETRGSPSGRGWEDSAGKVHIPMSLWLLVCDRRLSRRGVGRCSCAGAGAEDTSGSIRIASDVIESLLMERTLSRRVGYRSLETTDGRRRGVKLEEDVSGVLASFFME